jgi:fatty-acyl-CoA synthase
MAGRHTFVRGLEGNARYIPGALAVVQGRRLRTYEDLNARANQFGNALLKLGVRRGERIALLLTNRIEFLECSYGCWKDALVSVPVNYRFQDTELRHVLENADSVGVVVEAAFLPTIQRIRDQLPLLRFIIALDDVTADPEQGIYNYEALLRKASRDKPPLLWAEQRDEDTGYNIYTGGTTGLPKGISYTERDMLKTAIEALASFLPGMMRRTSRMDGAELRALPGGRWLDTDWGRRMLASPRTAQWATWAVEHAPLANNRFMPRRMQGRARALVASPMMHSVGWGVSHALTKMGGTVYLLEGQSYDPGEAFDLIREHRINFLAAIGDATLRPLLAVLDERGAQEIQHLSLIGAVGMPTGADVKERLLKTHLPQARFVDIIGGSEITGISFQMYTGRDAVFNKVTFPVSERNRIIDPETGVPVAPGEIGELARRTRVPPQGYYKDPEKTRKLIREFGGETWLMSGDLARLDESGETFTFVGRGSECINTGGEKVYPEEVETLLKKMPGVEQVGLTATPDIRYGDLVTAVIQPAEGASLTEADVMAFCRDKIAGYKRPRRVIFVDVFPTTLIGKPHYKALRDLARQTAGPAPLAQETTG